MILGIVGSEEAKFTDYTKLLAKEAIYDLIGNSNPKMVVSGGCHLGGIDKWAIEVAESLFIPTHEFLPTSHRWSGGYKERNQKIAEASDVVVCFTIRALPPKYQGMRFSRCYHCNTDSHVKSGGCWTVKYAKNIGKKGEVIVLPTDEI